jgi:glycosyltransferase involved in cell wall biosynthesis
MRVVMTIQKYYPFVGGAERQLQQLARRLRAQGIDVIIVTRQFDHLPTFEVVDQVPVYRLPAPGPKPLAALSYVFSALRLIGKLRPQIVHAHEMLSPATIALLSKRLYGSRVIVKVLCGGETGDVYKIKNRPLGNLRLRYLREQVDAFITISQEIDQELEQIGVPKAKRRAIPNGVDTQHFTPVSADEKRRIRLEFGLDPDSLLVLYSGRLHPYKRVDLLLEAWRGVFARYPAARLLILGSGSEEAALRRKAPAGVHFVGEVRDVAPYLQAADLYVMPSAREGLSNSVLEALSSGLPVVATTSGGTPDVIRHLQEGYLIPPNDGDALQQAMLDMLADDALRSRLAAQGRQRILAEYSFDAAVQRTLRLYHGVLEEALPA